MSDQTHIEDSFGTCWKCGTDRDDYNGSMKEDEQKGVYVFVC